MKLILKLTALLFITSILSQCSSNIKNYQTTNAKVSGNCGMCEERIEKAGNKKNEAKVDWNKQTKIATIIYNSSRTSKEQILRRIADAGHDNELYNATDSAYQELHGCCKFEREVEHDHSSHSHDDHEDIYMASSTEVDTMKTDGFEILYYSYYKLTDELSIDNTSKASDYAGSMYRLIKRINTKKLSSKSQLAWKLRKDLIKENVMNIANSANDLDKQRSYISQLTLNILGLMKSSKLKSPIYLLYCPETAGRKGGSWLSKENNTNKNPYQNNTPEPCGFLVETIDN